MTIWTLRAGRTAEVATLVVPEADRVIGSMRRFGGDGSALDWRAPVRLDAMVGTRQAPKPLGDLGPFLPGALVLGEKAHAALGPFLSQFGQLLALDVNGTPHWFFNVTNVVPCIDRERSELLPGGTIGKEAFIESALPNAPTVFKDPFTARARIYVNDAARHVIVDIASNAQLLGLRFLRAGQSPEASFGTG